MQRLVMTIVRVKCHSRLSNRINTHIVNVFANNKFGKIFLEKVGKIRLIIIYVVIFYEKHQPIKRKLYRKNISF